MEGPSCKRYQRPHVVHEVLTRSQARKKRNRCGICPSFHLLRAFIYNPITANFPPWSFFKGMEGVTRGTKAMKLNRSEIGLVSVNCGDEREWNLRYWSSLRAVWDIGECWRVGWLIGTFNALHPSSSFLILISRVGRWLFASNLESWLFYSNFESNNRLSRRRGKKSERLEPRLEIELLRKEVGKT